MVRLSATRVTTSRTARCIAQDAGERRRPTDPDVAEAVASLTAPRSGTDHVVAAHTLNHMAIHLRLQCRDHVPEDIELTAHSGGWTTVVA
jgi:hypothetical protein